MISRVTAPLEGGTQRRVDGWFKVTGQAAYAADLLLEDTLHAAVLRSPHPHARIVALDDAGAWLDGVHCVLTGADVPDVRCGRGLRDAPVLAVGKARFIGEPVAAVAADTAELAEEAVNRIHVHYEPLPAVFDVTDALGSSAPAIHDDPGSYANAAHKPEDPPNVIASREWTWGEDVERALAQSELRFEHTYRVQRVHQGYIEPHCCTVLVEPDGRVRVWSCNKVPYVLRENLAASFSLPLEKVEIYAAAVGGDFGGKGTPMDAPLCLELSRRTGRPVRMARTYAEELTASAPRHGATIAVRVGVTRDGRLQALYFRALLDSGAYGGFRPGAAMRSPCATSYRIPAARVEVTRVYTNELPAGNMRTPAAPQMTFALEGMLDLIARELGINPFELRRRNLLRDGEPALTGDVWPEVRGVATLDAAQKACSGSLPPATPHVRFGRGVAVYDRPTPVPQHTSLRLRLLADGGIEAQAPIQETGTGSHSVIQRVVADALPIDRSSVSIRYVGTADLPYDSGIGGSKITVTISEAAVRAAEAFWRQWKMSSAGADLTLQQLAGRGFEIEALAEITPIQEREAATSYCVQVAEVAVDIETGQVTIQRLVSAHDVAEIVEPVSHRGQIEGGVIMGIGFALMEDLNISEGRVTAAHLGEYKLPSAADIPPLEVVLVPGAQGVGARNVKSIGELANVAVAAAIANAVSDAVRGPLDSLPLTAEKVRAASRQYAGTATE